MKKTTPSRAPWHGVNSRFNFADIGKGSQNNPIVKDETPKRFNPIVTPSFIQPIILQSDNTWILVWPKTKRIGMRFYVSNNKQSFLFNQTLGS